jgi:uncharacterized protein YhaN
MRVERLELLAYGLYRDKTLDLSEPRSGLTIVVGPNEAGKSTARRALLAALWGFPRGAGDAYRYGPAGLRVGALLRSAGGVELHFVRQGIGTARVVDGDGNLLPESAVTAFLGGTTKELYERLFCIDHDELRTGSDELLDAEGEIGRLVFGAGLGTGSLGQVLQRLDARSGALYKESGRRQPVVESLTAYREAMRRAREARVRSREVDLRRAAVAEAREHVAGLRSNLEQRRAELARRERVRTALPLVAARSQLLDELELVAGEGTVATIEWAERALSALKVLDMAEERRSSIALRRTKLQEQLASAFVDDAVLDRAEVIEVVVGGLDRYEANRRELPEIRVRMEEARGRLDGCLRRVGIGPGEAARDWVVSDAQLAGVEALADAHAALVEAATSAARELAALDGAIAADRERLQDLPEPAGTDELVRALEVAAPVLPRVQVLDAAREEAARLRSDAIALANRLGLAGRSLEELEGLPVPTPVQIAEASVAMRALAERRQRLEEERREIAHKRRELARAIEALLAKPGLPEPERLEQARGRRDAGWSLVRRALGVAAEGSVGAIAAAIGEWGVLGATVPTTGDRTNGSSDPNASVRRLAEAYEVAVADADAAADERYLHAADLSMLEHLRAQAQEADDEEADVARRLDALEEEGETAQTRWSERWARIGVEAGSPTEMVDWRSGYGDLLALISDVKKAEDAVRVETRAVLGSAEAVSEALVRLGVLEAPPAETPLAMLVARAKDVVEAAVQQAQARARLQESLERALGQRTVRASDLEEAERRLASWQESWSAALVPLRLAGGTAPAAALGAVRALRDLESARREVASLDDRIRLVEREIIDYRTQVERAASTLALVGGARGAEGARSAEGARGAEGAADPMTVVPALRKRWDAAVEAAGRRRALREQLDELSEELEAAETDVRVVAATLDALRAEARCTPDEDVASVAARAQRIHALREEVAGLEKTLVEQGAGRTLEEILAESAQARADGDQLAAVVSTLQDDIAQLEEAVGAAQRALGEATNRLEAVSDAGTAADIEQDAQSDLARAATAAAEYARTAVAATVLRQVVANYGERHRGPILDRAGEIFADVTGGAFVKLVADAVGAQEVLLAQRRNGDPCRVEQLSDGARDQLYFSLRLAGIEYELSHLGEPLPVVFDDVLVNFDDLRSAAALRSLAALGAHTQVLVFTHHEGVVDAAKGVIDERHLGIVRLEERDHSTRTSVIGVPAQKAGPSGPNIGRAGGRARGQSRAGGRGDGRGGSNSAGTELGDAVLDVLVRVGKPMPKAEILAASGIREDRWPQVIRRLVDQGAVEQEGHKRGARYRAVGA